MAERYIHKIQFRREEHSSLEHGIAIGDTPDDTLVIIDQYNKVVPTPIWDFGKYIAYWEGTLILKFEEWEK